MSQMKYQSRNRHYDVPMPEEQNRRVEEAGFLLWLLKFTLKTVGGTFTGMALIAGILYYTGAGPEIIDRYTSRELKGIANREWLKYHHRSTYDAVANLPWVSDGLTQEEAKTVEGMFFIGVSEIANLQSLLELRWVQDSISPQENELIQWVRYLNGRNPETTGKIIRMPFLATVEETDVLLLDGLHRRATEGTLNRFLQQSTIIDGITQDEVVLATAATTLDDVDHTAQVLTPRTTTVETFQAASARTPNLRISIVRTKAARNAETVSIVQDSVRFVEDVMDLPLPTNHVILLLDDLSLKKGYAGTNFGYAIVYRKEAANGNDQDQAAFEQGMAHEVAHYFWTGNQNWVDEGIADTIEANLSAYAGHPPNMWADRSHRCPIKTLEELAKINPSDQDSRYICNYVLGEGLFLELQDQFGKEQFKNRLRTLYRISLSLREQRQEAGIDQVRRAFGNQTGSITKHWTGKELQEGVTGIRPPTGTSPSVIVDPR